MRWDMTMVPGAGFPEATVEAFARFDAPQFGRRVQHVLNDQTRLEAFLKVNASFKPQVVVFNNRHWEPGSFTRFHAKKFVFVEGAVDTEFFRPAPVLAGCRAGEAFVIGALANKNLEAVLDALDRLPEDIRLVTIGEPPLHSPRLERYLASGRLVARGLVDEQGLRDFYHSVDAVVHAERFAGWANIAAEAMASGVPVACSRPGTLAFAEDEVTALVIDEASGEAIANALLRLSRDPALRERLAAAGRKRIERYAWPYYAKRLIEACRDDGRDHYTFAPELGLHGKWPPVARLKGLEPLFESVAGKTVLDLACAEGVVARECLKGGAELVHGFELDGSRVAGAQAVCSAFPGERSLFRQADLSDAEAFFDAHGDVLLARYDVVLYLGLQHHLPYPARLSLLRLAARLAGEMLVIRTPEHVYQHDEMERTIEDAGFQLSHGRQDDWQLGTGGGLRVFVREATPVRPHA